MYRFVKCLKFRGWWIIFKIKNFYIAGGLGNCMGIGQLFNKIFDFVWLHTAESFAYHIIICSFCADKTNQKPVKENPLTSKDNFVVFQSALPCLIPPTNMSQAYLLNGVTENVPDIDIVYFTRSYFACHGRSYTFGCTQ